MIFRLSSRFGSGGFGRLLAVAGVLVSWPGPVGAHDIPERVVFNIFVAPEGTGTSMVVRVPLIMLADLDLPKRGPGYLDLGRIDLALPEAAAATERAIKLVADGVARSPSRVEWRIALPSDRSFESFEMALAAIRGPRLSESENVFWNQGFFDVHFEFPLRAHAHRLSLSASVAPALGDRVRLAVRFATQEGAIRALDIQGGIVDIDLDPSWVEAARLFLYEGILHILGGIDHLLFLFCLVLPFRNRFGGLVGIVTAFSVGHSITLIATALGFIPVGKWFPPVIETAIAASIVYMAVENMFGADFERRWIIGTFFGLIHGFGFAGALSETLQFAGSHLVAALLAFNLGIELGQLLVLALVVPALNLAFRRPPIARYGGIVLSITIGHEGWHWMLERAKAIRLADLPQLDLALAYRVFLWVLTAVFVGALFRYLLVRLTRVTGRRPPP
ncbi:MAG: HupE/UreJ family protein [Pseudomonadota bacterium]